MDIVKLIMRHRNRFEEYHGTPPEFLYIGENAFNILKDTFDGLVGISQARLKEEPYERFHDMKIARISNDPDHVGVG